MPESKRMILVTITHEVVIDPDKWAAEYHESSHGVLTDVETYFSADDARTVRPMADEDAGPHPFPPGMHGTTDGGVYRRTATVNTELRPVSAW